MRHLVDDRLVELVENKGATVLEMDGFIEPFLSSTPAMLRVFPIHFSEQHTVEGMRFSTTLDIEHPVNSVWEQVFSAIDGEWRPEQSPAAVFNKHDTKIALTSCALDGDLTRFLEVAKTVPPHKVHGLSSIFTVGMFLLADEASLPQFAAIFENAINYTDDSQIIYRNSRIEDLLQLAKKQHPLEQSMTGKKIALWGGRGAMRIHPQALEPGQSTGHHVRA
jgi:hypothetical protein